MGAWTADGHVLVARSAVDAVPSSLPLFFRQGGETVAHAAVDPDLFRLRDAPGLRDQESPEHYIDLEYLRGAPPRPRRYDYLRQLEGLDVDPARVGFLAHSLNEGVERLAVAFAEHRRFPDDPRIRAKTLYLAGLLAHYAADSCQPLHTTIHFDGRVPPGGASPRSGIHHRVDLLFGAALPPPAGADGVEPRVVAPLFDGILAEIAASHGLVDRVYELEEDLSRPAGEEPSPAVRRFADERYRASVAWVASLFLTAWDKSARFDLPFWSIETRRTEAAQPR